MGDDDRCAPGDTVAGRRQAYHVLAVDLAKVEPDLVPFRHVQRVGIGAVAIAWPRDGVRDSAGRGPSRQVSALVDRRFLIVRIAVWIRRHEEIAWSVRPLGAWLDIVRVHRLARSVEGRERQWL